MYTRDLETICAHWREDSQTKDDTYKGSCQKLLLSVMGVPPPYPLSGQLFSQKTLSGRGGYTLPPLMESPLSLSGKCFPKRAKNDVFCIK